MALTETRPRGIARPGPGYAYLMTGIALGCIVVSGILGSIFTPDMVTGTQHQHLAIAAFIGWIFDLIAISMVVRVAMQGIRAEVTDQAPWTALGLGVGAIWLAVMVVSIFTPVWVTGTDPTEIPIWGFFAAIAGTVLTGILCNFVNTTSFQLVESKAAAATITPTLGAEAATEDATVKLRRLAQLRESGAITEPEFQAKKTELLSRI